MTVRRVIIDGGAASPFRVSASGVDAAAAEFNALIFDGNQSPLRLWGTGFVMIDGMSQNEFFGGQNIREASAGAVLATPAGTTAVFITMWRRNDGINHLFTCGFQPSNNNVLGGGGGGICSGQFIGACFSTANTVSGDPNARPPPIFCNYVVFKNYL